MIKQRKKDYLCPSMKTAVADLEGLVCASVRFNVRLDVRPLENMNADEETDEVFYFES